MAHAPASPFCCVIQFASTATLGVTVTSPRERSAGAPRTPDTVKVTRGINLLMERGAELASAIDGEELGYELHFGEATGGVVEEVVVAVP